MHRLGLVLVLLARLAWAVPTVTPVAYGYPTAGAWVTLDDPEGLWGLWVYDLADFHTQCTAYPPAPVTTLTCRLYAPAGATIAVYGRLPVWTLEAVGQISETLYCQPRGWPLFAGTVCCSRRVRAGVCR